MPRDLTADITEPAITTVCLDEDRVSIYRNLNLSVNAANSSMSVSFGFYSADGVRRRTLPLTLSGDQVAALPALLAAYRAYRVAILAAAQAAGVIAPGVDVTDL